MKKYLLFLSCFFSITIFGQTGIFVNGSLAVSGNGNSWNTAKRTITEAISAAGANTTIYVKEGIYKENELIIPSGVTVTGGYDSTLTGTDTSNLWYPGQNYKLTILDGQGTHRVATVNQGGTLRGCVVQCGFHNEKGAGVLINGGKVVYCIIQYCSCTHIDRTAKGGGVYIQDNGILLNCVVAFNEANDGPGVAGTNGVLTNNTITQNAAVQCASCGTFNDIRGTGTSKQSEYYTTVKLGNQCWMRENMRASQYYSDGSPFSNSPTFVYTALSNYYLYKCYGANYSFSVAARTTSYTSSLTNQQGVCPTGWHIPTIAEWQLLKDYVSSQAEYQCNSNSANIAKALASDTLWTTVTTACSVGNNQSLNNTTWFSGYPMSTSDSYNLHKYSYWWSTSLSSSNRFYVSYLYYDYTGLLFSNSDVSGSSTTGSFPVRCVKNQ